MAGKAKVDTGIVHRETAGTDVAVFRIEGLSSLLQNNPASMRPTPTGVTVKKIPTPVAEAESKVYQRDGAFFIPAIAFRSCLLACCTGRKINKKAAIASMSPGVFNVEEECFLVDPKTDKPLKEYEIYTCRAVVMRAGVLRSRPMFRKWACDLALEVDLDFVNVAIVHEMLALAGKAIGIQDFRPQKKGTFGRFKVTLKSTA